MAKSNDVKKEKKTCKDCLYAGSELNINRTGYYPVCYYDPKPISRPINPACHNHVSDSESE